jgi:PAS domain S-box-containing protein
LVVARRIRHRWSNLRLRGKGLVTVASPVAVLLVASVIFLMAIQADSRAESAIRHSRDAQRQIAVVDGLILARESDQRGYLLLSDRTELAAAGQADAALGAAVTSLAAMVGDNATQRATVAGLSAALAKEPVLPAGAAPLTSDQATSWVAAARAATAEARRQLSAMDGAESRLISDRGAAADHGRRWAVIGVLALLAIGVLGAGIGSRLFASGMARRVDRLRDEIGRPDRELTAPPDDSADELGVLARRMRTTTRALATRESELGVARAFLENILMVGPVVVVRSVLDGEATYVSPNCERVLGISSDAALAADLWRRTVAAEDSARFAAVTAPLFEPAGPAVVEFEGTFDLGGRSRYLSCLVTREALGDDERGVLLYLLDATDRHDAEQEVAEARRELSAITTASPDIIVVFGADLRIRFLSEAITSVTGMRAADRIGRTLGQAVHQGDRGRLVDAVRAVISGAAEDFTERIRVPHTDGHYLVLEGHGRPLLGSDGAPVAAVAIFRDVSDRIALEAELVEARDVATAASGAKSEFLSRMSHELRTPLNVVLGFTQLLQMEPLADEQRAWVDQVLRAGRHLLDLINEVLDIARIESGVLALSPEPVSLRDVVGAAVEQLRPVAAAEGVALDYLIEGSDLYVQADRQRLMQVLFNLLANAAKYNRPGGTVLITGRLRDQQLVEIRVSDTGIGIAPEHIQRLFVPFDRLGAEKSMIEGTGVGLPLALRLVQAMDGELLVESTPGIGSTFIVVLPRVQSPSELGGVLSLAGADFEPSSEQPGPCGDLLYIEDNLTNRNLMERLVARRPGVRLLQALDGRTGLELARRNGADLILLDLHLPDMSGTEVLARLRANPATADIPVYIVSADATAVQVLRVTNAGAAGYLTKPLDVRRVLALLDELLDRRVPVTEGD